MTTNMADEMNKSFGQLSGHLTDLKEMLVDQNEWYEEIFYDNDCAEPEGEHEHQHGDGHLRVFGTPDSGDHKHQSEKKNDLDAGKPIKKSNSKKFSRQNSRMSKQVRDKGSVQREGGFVLPVPRKGS